MRTNYETLEGAKSCFTCSLGKVNMHWLLTLLCFSVILGTSGDGYNLECFNDYKSTISCSLNVSAVSTDNTSAYWLQFSSFDEYYNCTLTRREASLVCILDLGPEVMFTDTDSYSISLHSGCHGNSCSVALNGDYVPKKHVRPLEPHNLSLLWNKTGAVFQWQMELYTGSLIIKYLQYQLNIYSKDSEPYNVEVSDQNVSVETSRFKPHTNYTARVRSRPYPDYYNGVWSHWSTSLHWNSGNIHESSPEGSFHAIMYLLPISLALLFCFSYSRCRKQEYIPSPAPYLRAWNVDAQIQTLQSQKVSDIMHGEEALQMDILIENKDTPPPLTTLEYEMMEMTDGQRSTPKSPSMLHSPEGSEVDSGCWIRDAMATQRGSITCSEDYCTLSQSQNTYGV
ncbi:interleukin-4 receptor subunit alpha isoform X1 [Misgurnus anguillicaudatus]|uniref:interleukin-4 receptor subunit alpha isoform X1 n=2 Tax=Misgurnus anguillicaudatus TaxID=75329 RepID=UPI003CCFB7E2